MRRLWLCADDYGIAPGVNAAIRDLIERGRLNATSVMVVAPSFARQSATCDRMIWVELTPLDGSPDAGISLSRHMGVPCCDSHHLASRLSRSRKFE